VVRDRQTGGAGDGLPVLSGECVHRVHQATELVENPEYVSAADRHDAGVFNFLYVFK
jgi:hypothetical protein